MSETSNGFAVVSGDLPEPPYPPTTTGLPQPFRIAIASIEASDEWALMSGDERAHWIMAMVLSWGNVPAGSLSKDDSVIREHFSEAQILSDRGPLFGWDLHSDGRFYHPIMTDAVIDLIHRREMRDGWADLRLAILERDNNTCRYCGRQQQDMHVDHVTPRSRGGSNDPSNLVAACPACNLSKSDKTPAEWLA